MTEEYGVLRLFPAGHVMAKLRSRFNGGLCTSQDIDGLSNGSEITTAGLVIRRQRPHGKVVFMTLEDEFGLIPLMVFPQVYERQEYEFREPFLMVKGKLTRREGTHNVVVTKVKPFSVMDKIPESKNWR
jgi:error-prone DNA polymerase